MTWEQNGQQWRCNLCRWVNPVDPNYYCALEEVPNCWQKEDMQYDENGNLIVDEAGAARRKLKQSYKIPKKAYCSRHVSGVIKTIAGARPGLSRTAF